MIKNIIPTIAVLGLLLLPTDRFFPILDMSAHAAVDPSAGYLRLITPLEGDSSQVASLRKKVKEFKESLDSLRKALAEYQGQPSHKQALDLKIVSAEKDLKLAKRNLTSALRK